LGHGCSRTKTKDDGEEEASGGHGINSLLMARRSSMAIAFGDVGHGQTQVEDCQKVDVAAKSRFANVPTSSIGQ
jgi:hypothetical protein